MAHIDHEVIAQGRPLCASPPPGQWALLCSSLSLAVPQAMRDPKAKWMSILLPRLSCVLESLGDLIQILFRRSRVVPEILLF